MKYMKRLKKELANLSLDLRGQILQRVPTHHGNRARALQYLVLMLKEVVHIDHATDDWSEGNAKAWLFYLADLERWLDLMPKVPEKYCEEKPSSEEAA